MITNRELTLDDYLSTLRRRLKLILVPVLISPLAGFLISYAFPPKYTSQSVILVEEQKVPEGYVKPVVTEDLPQRIATMQQRVMARDRLQPLIERLGLAHGRSLDETIDDIRNNLLISPIVGDIGGSSASVSPGSKVHRKPGQSELAGFTINFTSDNARTAQEVCAELTSMFIDENLKDRQQVAQGTTDFLSRRLEEAKRNLDDLDAKLAAFKKQYLGQLPGDEDTNLKILMGLNSQLESNTQTLNRAEQDKGYAVSMLAQQLGAWKSSQGSTSPQSLQQQLSLLQSELVTLHARYTDDHPDVVKTKADIAEVKRKLNELNSATPEANATAEKGNASEPPEIRQLRLQIHQYDDAIVQATRDQKRLRDQIAEYESRVALSPAVEEQYKELNRDYDTGQKLYNDLLAKKSESEMQTDLERRQQGEQMSLLQPAGVPDSPSFPVRWIFALGGLGGGLALGLALAVWMELRDNAIRTEEDVVAVLDLPALISVPWVNASNGGGNGFGPKRGWRSSKETEVKV